MQLVSHMLQRWTMTKKQRRALSLGPGSSSALPSAPWSLLSLKNPGTDAEHSTEDVRRLHHGEGDRLEVRVAKNKRTTVHIFNRWAFYCFLNFWNRQYSWGLFSCPYMYQAHLVWLLMEGTIIMPLFLTIFQSDGNLLNFFAVLNVISPCCWDTLILSSFDHIHSPVVSVRAFRSLTLWVQFQGPTWWWKKKGLSKVVLWPTLSK